MQTRPPENDERSGQSGEAIPTWTVVWSERMTPVADNLMKPTVKPELCRMSLPLNSRSLRKLVITGAVTLSASVA